MEIVFFILIGCMIGVIGGFLIARPHCDWVWFEVTFDESNVKIITSTLDEAQKKVDRANCTTYRILKVIHEVMEES